MQLKLEVNGKAVCVKHGSTIIQAIQQAGMYVPHFCYHEKLSIAANCRMCMVEVEKIGKAVPACATPVTDGMVVKTDSERAKKAQQGVMEFLLINHPLDCPICDQGGECQLQDLAVGYGLSRSRYQEEKRVVFEKNLGPLIATDMTRCIHCTRCVRFGREVAGIMELGMVGRGEHAEIMPFIEKTVDSELSGNMIDICPVGALTSKPFRYTARPWELRRFESVATHDSWGSHISVHVKDNTVKRVVPSRAPGVHEHWISDRDRFSYQGLTSADRVLSPATRPPNGKSFSETAWQTAISELAQNLRATREKHGSDSIAFFVSPRATCEEALLTRRIADHLGAGAIDSRLRQRHFDGDDITGFGMPLSKLADIHNILFIGAEPSRELPLLAATLRGGRKRKKIFSISAKDISGSVPVGAQHLCPPQNISAALENILNRLNAGLPEGYVGAGADAGLFAGGEDVPALTQIAEQLQKNENKGNTVIWLGDVARGAYDYGVIVALARRLAAHVGCPIGTLADGGNGAGARIAGALPPEGGMNTAQILAGDNIKTVVLLRCETEDFAQPALAKELLKRADFVAAITTHKDKRISKYASVILPAAEFCETGATIINGNGEATVSKAVTPPPGKARPAWKILRLLGEYLGAPGFEFSDISAARQWLAEIMEGGANNDGAGNENGAAAATAITTATAPLPLQQPAPAAGGGYALYGGAPLYGGDMLTRRADALAKTRHGKVAHIAQMHPDDMLQENLRENDAVVISDSDGNSEKTTVIANDTLARGVVLYFPSTLKAPDGITIAADVEREQAAG